LAISKAGDSGKLEIPGAAASVTPRAAAGSSSWPRADAARCVPARRGRARAADGEYCRELVEHRVPACAGFSRRAHQRLDRAAADDDDERARGRRGVNSGDDAVGAGQEVTAADPSCETEAIGPGSAPDGKASNQVAGWCRAANDKEDARRRRSVKVILATRRRLPASCTRVGVARSRVTRARRFVLDDGGRYARSEAPDELVAPRDAELPLDEDGGTDPAEADGATGVAVDGLDTGRRRWRRWSGLRHRRCWKERRNRGRQRKR